MTSFNIGDKVTWNYQTAELIPRVVPTPAVVIGVRDGGFIELRTPLSAEMIHKSWLEPRTEVCKELGE